MFFWSEPESSGGLHQHWLSYFWRIGCCCSHHAGSPQSCLTWYSMFSFLIHDVQQFHRDTCNQPTNQHELNLAALYQNTTLLWFSIELIAILGLQGAVWTIVYLKLNFVSYTQFLSWTVTQLPIMIPRVNFFLWYKTTYQALVKSVGVTSAMW